MIRKGGRTFFNSQGWTHTFLIREGGRTLKIRKGGLTLFYPRGWSHTFLIRKGGRKLL